MSISMDNNEVLDHCVEIIRQIPGPGINDVHGDHVHHLALRNCVKAVQEFKAYLAEQGKSVACRETA